MKLRFDVAVGAMKLIASSGYQNIWESFGVSKADYEVVTGSGVWTVDQRGKVTDVLDSLIVGTMDISGGDRFEPPAEYIAAIVTCFVSGCNVRAACG